MKKLFLFFSLMVATMALVSCGNDDEPNLQFDKETIVGAWEITEVQGTPEWWWIGFSMEDSYKIEGGQVKTFYAETQEPMYIYELQGKKGNTLTVKMKGTLDESNLSTVFKMSKK